MKTLFQVLIALLIVSSSLETLASDAYLIRFSAIGGPVGNVLWADDILLFNANAEPVQVKLLGVSNGSLRADAPTTLTLPPGRTVSINQEIKDSWTPVSAPFLWTVHLDIPAGVVVESRDEFYSLCCAGVTLPPQPLGKVSMPIYRGLVPAGKSQIHVGTDLSGNISRANVGIYNAGSDTATATIEIRRTCDDMVVDTRTVSVPPNATVQVGGLQTASGACGTGGWRRYTIVTVSQPSLTYVANLNENLPAQLGISGVAPVVGLAVTKSEGF